MTSHTFGEMLKGLRQKKGMTLRDFCQTFGFDPGNHSRLERGHLPAPQRHDQLERIAEALGLVRDSEEWVELLDRAAASRGQLPPDLMSDSKLLSKLPALFRTLRGCQISPDNLDKLVETIRRS
jgi:transcriptional regulator with XRE-family HTH domain